MKDTSDFNLAFRLEEQRVSTSISQVYLELSTECNLNCKTCVRTTISGFEKTHFSRALMKRLLPMLKKARPERVVLLGFGEALCNPHIEQYLALLRGLDSKLVLVTNATLLTDDRAALLVDLPVDEVYVSWDDDIHDDNTRIRRGAAAAAFRANIESFTKKRDASGTGRPLIGLQMVATRSNYSVLPAVIGYGSAIGIDRFIVSNVFAYSETMAGERLYDNALNPHINLRKLLDKEIRRCDLRIANQKVDIPRQCPFIEQGTMFVTVRGDVTPCPELAYSHSACYFGIRREHRRMILGNIKDRDLSAIWTDKHFTFWRNSFLYYDFPDCSYCSPDSCYPYSSEGADCYLNKTPCGECLWAKNIVICP